jgi:hypothetical protein
MDGIGIIVLTDAIPTSRLVRMTIQASPTLASPARRRSDDQPFNPWLRWSVETPAQREVLTSAELSECRCPDLCDRDHANE